MGSARTAAVLTGLSLVLPSVALAQGQPDQSAGAPQTGQTAPPLSSSAPSSTPRPAPKRSAAAAPAPARRLPSTGVDAGMLALAGTGLLLTGAGLRLRLREPTALP